MRKFTDMGTKILTAAAVSAALLFSGGSTATAQAPAIVAAQATTGGNTPHRLKEGFQEALSLYRNGMYAEARASFSALAEINPDMMAEGYAVLCSEYMKTPGYEKQVKRYLDGYPHSPLIPLIRFNYALNLFDAEEFREASYLFKSISPRQLPRSQRSEYLFKRAYCDFEEGNNDLAKSELADVSDLNSSDYSGPARYALGYLNYEEKNFKEAIGWFEKALSDERFTAMSNYYILDSRYMLKDYEYVTKNGTAFLNRVPKECCSHLSRIIAESYLVLGDPSKARQFFDLGSGSLKERSDYFFAGSLMYAVKDWKGAIENYSLMQDRTDSIGQVANYNMAYSFIQTKNKVAAMRCFRDASSVGFDPKVTEDALFNYAKLAFDLNNDNSAFDNYISRYSTGAKGDRIYSYMAVAALRNRDYAAAVEAFDKIDELDADMRSNYMKTNYLRAFQLIGDGAYRDAVPCLKASAYYAEKGSAFWQLSRFWLAESLFRGGDYDGAISIFTELRNTSALDGREESSLIPFSLGYCNFKKGDYDKAIRWFDEYIDSGAQPYRKTSSIRKADCYFMKKSYKSAIIVYEQVASDYPSVNDIYPYYQAGICYGLTGSEDLKIKALSPVTTAKPDSRFWSEAVFELGRAYVATSDASAATDCFNLILDNVRDSTYMARALIELGMISRNAGDYDSALSRYKEVVDRMPVSTYADDAIAAIESIYRTRGDAQAFLDYLDAIGRPEIKTDAEREAIIFNAAEQTFFSEDYEKALAALESYMTAYPRGRLRTDALFYIAECHRNLGQKEAACDAYFKVLTTGSESFGESALLRYAQLTYSLQRYSDSYEAWGKLLETARMEQNKPLARIGMMRSAYRARNFELAIAASREVRDLPEAGPDLCREADWTLAKSYMSTSRRAEALRIMEQLAAEPKTEEGAEASYIIIQDLYDKGKFETVEAKVYEFAESGSSRQYWIARAFLVLGDSFVEMDDKAQALATWQSIIDGYTPSGADDDIVDNARLRIERTK